MELRTFAAMLKSASEVTWSKISLRALCSVTYDASTLGRVPNPHWKCIEGSFSEKKSFNMTVNGRILGRFSTSMNSPREAGPFETRLESDDSDWTMTDNRSRTLKTTFAVIKKNKKKSSFSQLVVRRPNRPYTPSAPVRIIAWSRDLVISREYGWLERQRCAAITRPVEMQAGQNRSRSVPQP